MKLSSLRTLGGTLQLRPSTSVSAPSEVRQAMSWEAYQSLFSFNGSQYLASPFQSYGGRHLIGSCGPVHAALDRRTSVMGEARPTFQRFKKGVPDEMFSTPALDALKSPWSGGSWRILVTIAESDVAACGNSYWIRPQRELFRLNPEWVTIITDDVMLGDSEVGYRLVGYAVQQPGHKPMFLEPNEVAHYRPGVSIENPFRGESWLAAVASDASSDVEMTRYKGNYLKNGAMPSLAVTYEPTVDMEQIEQFVGLFKDKFVGSMNAGKVMHFMGGRDIKTVGATLDQLAFKAVQGAGETRIGSAAGVPAVIAGFSEGMQGSSLNAGNFGATRRLFGDVKIRPLLGSFCDAFSNLIDVPSDARLWYDDSQVSFFQEDVADEASIRNLHATTIRTLIEGGYEPDAAVDAVTTGNLAALKGSHSGRLSVQLQGPEANAGPTEADKARSLAEMIQKIYLGVGVVLTADEAREIVNQAGGSLPPGVDVSPDVPPASPPAGAPNDQPSD